MTRIPFPDLDAAPDRVRAFFEKSPYDLAVIRMMAHAPGAFPGWLALSNGTVYQNQLGDTLGELAVCVAALHDSPDYEFAHHRFVAVNYRGVSAEQVAALEDRRFRDDVFTPQEQALLVFCDEVVRNVKACDETFAEARRHFSDRQLVELIMIVGQYMLNSRVAENTGVTVDDDKQFAKPGQYDLTAHASSPS